jgi:hypothetical protein
MKVNTPTPPSPGGGGLGWGEDFTSGEGNPFASLPIIRNRVFKKIGQRRILLDNGF